MAQPFSLRRTRSAPALDTAADNLHTSLPGSAPPITGAAVPATAGGTRTVQRRHSLAGELPPARRAATQDGVMSGFRSLGTDEISAIIEADRRGPGHDQDHPYALSAALTVASKRLRQHVAQTRLHPRLGPLLADAELTFSRPADYQIAHEIGALAPTHRRLALERLIDRLGSAGPGTQRLMRFAALCTACKLLGDADHAAMLERLAGCLPLLPAESATPGLAACFSKLHARARLPPKHHTSGLLTALAARVHLLPEVDQLRSGAVLRLMHDAGGLALPHQGEMFCALVRTTSAISDPQAGIDQAERLAVACEAMPASFAKAAVLRALACHAGFIGDPDVLACMARLRTAAGRLPVAAQAQVLARLTQLLATVDPHVLGDAIQMLMSWSAELPAGTLGEFQRQMAAHVGLQTPETVGNLLDDADTYSLHASRNNIALRLGQLTVQEQCPALHALLDRFDVTVPPALRLPKFIALYDAMHTQPADVKALLMPEFAARLNLLAAPDLLVPMVNLREDSLELPAAAQAKVIAALSLQSPALPQMAQDIFTRRLVQQARVLETPAERSEALLALAANTWRLDDPWLRRSVTAELCHCVHELPAPQRLAALPELVRNLTRFNVGAELDNLLDSLRRLALAAPADDPSRPPALLRLAANLGECSPAARFNAIASLRLAAHQLPDEAGRPILAILDRHSQA